MKGPYYGDGISHFRIEREMSPKQLADHLKMSRQNLTEIEKNRRTIDDTKIALAAQVLETTPEEIKAYKKGKKSQSFSSHDQSEQYNHCTIEIPESVLKALTDSNIALQEALKSSEASRKATQDALMTTLDLLKNLKEAFDTSQHTFRLLLEKRQV